MSQPNLTPQAAEVMSEREALRVLNTAAMRVCMAGFVMNGELTLCRPRTPGIMTTQATVAAGAPARVTYTPVRTPAKATALLSLDNWPRASAVADEVDEAPDTATGNVCDQCGGSRFQRTGTCMTCLDCGTPSGGCS